MRRHRPASKRQGQEDAQAEDNLQFVTVAAAQQEISKDTIPSPARESRTSGQLGTDPNPGEWRGLKMGEGGTLFRGQPPVTLVAFICGL